VKPGKMKGVDVILVTHEHFDHCDKQAIEEIVANTNSLVVAHESVLDSINVPKNYKRPVRKNESVKVKGVEIKALSAHHPTSFYPLAYHMSKDNFSLFHAGDTNIITSVNTLKCNVAMLPIGGIRTMDVVDAVKVVKTIKPDYAIPMHYNTFERITASPHEFREKIEKSILKTKPVILKPGEEVDFK